MNKLHKTIPLTLTLLLLSATPAFAQTAIQISRIGTTGVSSVNRLLSAGFTVAVVLAVVFVFGMLIMGGYAWITAGGDKAKVEEARTRITNALIGLAIVASAFALIALVGNFFGVSISNIQLPTASSEVEG